MTNSKHTPTPWVYNGTWVQDGMDILTESGTQIATTSFAGFISGVTDEANAAHIVKCVNMHDELVEALKDIDKAVSKGNFIAIRDLVRAALAKARGEQS